MPMFCVLGGPDDGLVGRLACCSIGCGHVIWAEGAGVDPVVWVVGEVELLSQPVKVNNIAVQHATGQLGRGRCSQRFEADFWSDARRVAHREPDRMLCSGQPVHVPMMTDLFSKWE